MPAATCCLSLRASGRSTRPLTVRADRRSQDFTRRAVAGPNAPSTLVTIPTLVRYFCRVFTSLPDMPWRSVRFPSLAASASPTDTDANTSPATARLVTSVRQRDKTIPFPQPPTGLAVGLARKKSRYAAYIRRFAPGPRSPGPKLLWFPRSRRPPPAGLGVMSRFRGGTLAKRTRVAWLPVRSLTAADGERLDAATHALDPPFAVVDLDAFDANARDLLRRAGGKRLRLASKSVRVRAL